MPQVSDNAFVCGTPIAALHFTARTSHILLCAVKQHRHLLDRCTPNHPHTPGITTLIHMQGLHCRALQPPRMRGETINSYTHKILTLKIARKTNGDMVYTTTPPGTHQGLRLPRAAEDVPVHRADAGCTAGASPTGGLHFLPKEERAHVEQLQQVAARTVSRRYGGRCLNGKQGIWSGRVYKENRVVEVSRGTFDGCRSAMLCAGSLSSSIIIDRGV